MQGSWQELEAGLKPTGARLTKLFLWWVAAPITRRQRSLCLHPKAPSVPKGAPVLGVKWSRTGWPWIFTGPRMTACLLSFPFLIASCPLMGIMDFLAALCFSILRTNVGFLESPRKTVTLSVLYLSSSPQLQVRNAPLHACVLCAWSFLWFLNIYCVTSQT